MSGSPRTAPVAEQTPEGGGVANGEVSGTPYPVSSPRSRIADWTGLVARLVLGGVLVAAGLAKVTDLTASTQSVLAYELFSYDVARVIGITLPVVEIAVGLLLVLGLLTRSAGIAGATLMLVFVAGIASAWARGLTIDCGCFGTGGPVAPEDTTYLVDIVRDLGLMALGIWLAVRPRTALSLDTS